MNTKLGISIPTYKRPEQLTRCLQSVIESARPFSVPVYVLDDSGDDTNVAAVTAMQQTYPYLYSIRNPENLGIDCNIVKSVNTCECEYVWLLGEDDRLVKDGVQTVLAALESRPDFLYVNYSTVNEDITTVLRERAIPLDSDSRLSADEFLAAHGWAAGFLGGCVVHRAKWAQVTAEPYIGTYFAHVGTIFHSIHGGTVAMLARPLVLNRCGSVETFTWRAVTFDVLGGWARLMERMRPVYGEDVCRRSVGSFERAHGLNSLKFLLYARSGGAYDLSQFRTYVQPHNRGVVYQAAAFVIAWLPQRLLRMIHHGFSKLRARGYRQLLNEVY